MNIDPDKIIENLDVALKDFEIKQMRVERANSDLKDASSRLKDLLGTSSMDLKTIQDEAHRKIGMLMLAQRRING